MLYETSLLNYALPLGKMPILKVECLTLDRKQCYFKHNFLQIDLQSIVRDTMLTNKSNHNLYIRLDLLPYDPFTLL